ncbi:MAG: HAD-IIA family hydrolase [Candidatus Lokiarchaeota archaeon]|nr:HAD-IIA family hydrolase [Candidatus Lokiarchaeota archaeon]
MQVVILSAGIGTRLKPITDKKPKCLVDVCSKPILQHQIDNFFTDDRIDEIIIVIGYMADLVRNFIKTIYNNDPKIILIENEDFLTTNNMYSLFLTNDYIKNSFLLINGDVILDPEIIDEFIKFPIEDAIAVDVGQYYKESMKVIQKEDLLIDISKGISKTDALGSSIDFYKFSKKGKDIFFSKMEEIISRRKNATQWTEVAIQELINSKTLELRAYDIEGKAWAEIDNFDDLYEAEIKFNNHISKLKEKKVFFFDLDGTIYLEGEIFEGVHELIKFMNNFSTKFFFMSNNSSFSTEEYLSKLKNLGIKIEKDNIIISTHPTIQYLKENNFKRIYLLGTKSLQSEFLKYGFILTDKDPEILVLGFDKELTYKKLENAAYLLQEDIPYIATHPDVKCPTKRGYIPDVGSIIALLYESTGKKPKIFGKPNKEMLLFKLRELDFKPRDAVIVGDRLYTDIRMGIEAGVTTICVLTGETSREMIEESKFKPDIILNKAIDLLKFLK